MKYVMVGFGGAVGSVLRFWLGSYLGDRFGTRFPYGTLVINITGCFLAGMIVTLMAERMQGDSNWRYLIPIGLIGGYTTFSAFAYETFHLVQNGRATMAALNVALSVVVGFAGVWAGAIAGQAIP
ncbi:MAG: fluoride efflux transporter CrcB [Terriglobales bacterium]|jgi:CrcB protein